MSTSSPKRHHYIPRVYLRAWTDEQGRVAVRRRQTGSFVTSIDNVGVEVGLHGTGPNATTRENFFGLMEGNWPTLLTGLTGDWPLNPDLRREVALYLAFQRVRGREDRARTDFIALASAAIAERPISPSAMQQFLRTEWGIPAAEAVEAQAAADYVNYAQNDGFEGPEPGLIDELAVKRLAPRFEALSWRIEKCRKPMLFTSDVPVMAWKPKSERDTYEGVGIANCAEVRFPLDPRHLLVLSSGNTDQGTVMVPADRFVVVNQDIASRCFEFTISAPSRRHRLDEVRMARHRPAMRFNLGPGVEVQPDGSERDMGEILHFWTPSHDDV